MKATWRPSSTQIYRPMEIVIEIDSVHDDRMLKAFAGRENSVDTFDLINFVERLKQAIRVVL